MKNTQETKEKKSCKTSDNKPKRNEKGQLLPGNTANPYGRPVFSLTSILRDELQKCPEGKDKKTYAILFIRRLLAKAIKDGDHPTQKLIMNYIEGMPTTTIDLKDERAINQILDELNGETNTEE